MKVAILGYGVDGEISAKYWRDLGHEIIICDQKTDLKLPDFVSASNLGPDYLKQLDQYDLLVRSPGLHPKEIVAANPENPDILNRVTTSVNEFFAKSKSPIIGVTGTKGKGTTCTLIYKILQEAGIKTFLGGNIGNNPLEFVYETTPESWVVLELSNFQMIDYKYAPKIGVCLMMAPEHQDWHETVKEYTDAKKQLFSRQGPESYLIYNANNVMSTQMSEVSKAKKIPYFVPDINHTSPNKEGSYVESDAIYMQNKVVCLVKDVALLGRFNLENVCAAIAATWDIIGQNNTIIKNVVSGFKGLEHRLEFVREINGVKYYNDSFATTPEATIAAIRSFSEPKVVILGGHDKGVPLFAVADEISKTNIRKVILIGETGEKMLQLLVQRGFENVALGGNTMAEIVKTAAKYAQPGDVVLLSTASASFGLFENYKDRGNQFKRDVANL